MPGDGEGNVAHIMGAVLNAPVLADGLSADGGRQDGVADEPGSLAGRPPEPGRGGAGKNIPSDADNGADMIGPFGPAKLSPGENTSTSRSSSREWHFLSAVCALSSGAAVSQSEVTVWCRVG